EAPSQYPVPSPYIPEGIAIEVEKETPRSNSPHPKPRHLGRIRGKSAAPVQIEPANSRSPACPARDGTRNSHSADRMRTLARHQLRKAWNNWRTGRLPSRPSPQMVAADRARRPGRGGEAGLRYSQFSQQLVPQKPSGKAEFLG